MTAMPLTWAPSPCKDNTKQIKTNIYENEDHLKTIQTILKKGLLHKSNHRFDDAIACFKEILGIQADHLEANNHIGDCLRKSGRLDDAHKYYKKVLMIDPSYSPVHASLTAFFLQKQQPEQAMFHAQKAEAHFNTDPQFLYRYGLIFFILNQLHMAANQFTKVLSLDPNHNDAIMNLSIVKILLGDLKNAESMLLNRNKIYPNNYSILLNLGFCNEQQGQIEQAIEYYKQAASINHKNSLDAYSGQLLLRHYQWQNSPEKLYKYHCQFSDQLEKKNIYHFNSKDYSNQVKINIGYVSSDFKKHPVGFFIFPVLQNHDQSTFHIFCYSRTKQYDDMTKKIKNLVYKWTDIRSLSNDAICKAIQKDRIHILVDLAGHTSNNCLSIFAMKPAPVQVSYLGYPGTTGIQQIDYRITDKWADPPGSGKYYAEKLVRMPNCFLCYHPESETPLVSDLPAKKSGWVSFGSFNRIAKLNDNILEIWAQILKGMDKSRLFLKTKAFHDPAIQHRIKTFFKKRGIENNRLILLSLSPSRDQHLSMYNHMDIALDTFPYHGTTTTCEALWMGVPVITLEGKAHVSRASLSILKHIGLDDCIARTTEEYIDKAIQLGSNNSFLSQLRHRLRPIVSRSSLCQVKEYVSDLEEIYQWMWKQIQDKMQ